MFYGVPMDIIHMPVEIFGVTKGMFPKPPLPNPVSFRLRLEALNFSVATPIVSLHGWLTNRLIKPHREEKSPSSGGKVQMQWRWSGNSTQASIRNGRVRRARTMASCKHRRTRGAVKIGWRRKVLTVKKYVPPLISALRYCGAIGIAYFIGAWNAPYSCCYASSGMLAELESL
jgi:hypothetical protein